MNLLNGRLRLEPFPLLTEKVMNVRVNPKARMLRSYLKITRIKLGTVSKLNSMVSSLLNSN